MTRSLSPSTEKNKAIFLGRLSNGETPEAIRLDMRIPSGVARAWMKDPQFQAVRDEVLAVLHDNVTHTLASRIEDMTNTALQSVKDGMQEDPKLALAWLKETGALRTAGNLAGLETSNVAVVTGEGGLTIVIATEPPPDVARMMEADVISTATTKEEDE